jgi:hypothetical protein
LGDSTCWDRRVTRSREWSQHYELPGNNVASRPTKSKERKVKKHNKVSHAMNKNPIKRKEDRVYCAKLKLNGFPIDGVESGHWMRFWGVA